MKKIVNPFIKRNDGTYCCFGCSPYNANGLQMEFWSTHNEVICKWKPDKKFEGYIDIVHGGIQATMHDEIAAWVIYTMCETSGVTSKMEVKYKKPLEITGYEITIRGKVESANRRIAVISTSIEDNSGAIISTAVVTYFLFPQQVAIEKYSYPGVDAFYEQ